MIRSEEQIRAIGSNSSQFIVRASAGSGKTSVLVDRYLRCVTELGMSPENIVAVTFTRKAATEMRLRIVRELKIRGLYKEAQMAETGAIQTILSFCERILREHSIAAGIDPSFEVFEGPQGHLLAERAIRNAIFDARMAMGPAGRLIENLAGRRAYRDNLHDYGFLPGMIKNTLGKLRSSGLSIDQLRAIYETPNSTQDFWRQSFQDSLPDELNQYKIQFGKENWLELLKAEIKSRRINFPISAKKNSKSADFNSAVDSSAFISLVCNAWENLEACLMAKQVLDFPLMESLAVELLEKSEEARCHITSNIHALLVDESQDLNPVQYRLLDHLNSHNSMFVGDPQQSIYRFRHADFRLFVERMDLLETLKLTKNHRTDEGILRFIDKVFSAVWGANYQPMSSQEDVDDPFGTILKHEYPGVELWPTKGLDPEVIAKNTKELIGEGIPPASIAILVHTNQVCHKISDSLKDLGVKSIIIGGKQSLYAELEIRDLANVLTLLGDPQDRFSFLSVVFGPLVGLSMDSLVLLANSQDIWATLTSKKDLPSIDHPKIDQFLAWFERARDIVHRVPAWEVIMLLLNETPFLENLAREETAERAIANVRKILSDAMKLPDWGALEFANLVRDTESVEHFDKDVPPSPDSNESVTLMTIHNSKGLEFDVVILPETFKDKERLNSKCLVDSRRGLIITNMEGEDSFFFKWLAGLEQKDMQEERERVYYVAMTRAKKRLCLAVDIQSKIGSFSRLIISHSGFPSSIAPGIFVREQH